MEMLATAIDKKWYNVFYHPYVNNFMIIKTDNEEHYVVKEFNGKWRCLKSNAAAAILPVEQLYDYTLEAISSGILRYN